MIHHAQNGNVRRETPPTRRCNTLAPVAYNELLLPSLRLTRSSRWFRRLANGLLVMLVASIGLMLFAPWQQSVTGRGSVVAYAPSERKQVIEAPIEGRIVRWGEGIVENARVAKGQLIVEIQDLDPLLKQRLQEQLTASERQVEAARQHLAANQRNLEAMLTVVQSYQAQVTAYGEVKRQIIASAEAYVDNAEQKVTAEEQHLLEQKAAFAQVEADFQRQKQLYEEKIASQLKFQEAERKYKEAEAKVAKTYAYVQAAKDELSAKERERDAKGQKAQVDIDYATALFRKAHGDVAKSESEIAKVQGEMQKTEKELADAQVKLARQQSQQVVAPLDGFIVQITPNQGSQLLKVGDMLCVIVPDTEDRAAQLWLSGNDAPLVEPGRHVRLQFEGWPAVQIAGWPSLAVGNFGGKVVSVDAVDDGKGQYRILVLPDERDPGAKWPQGRFLRQGAQVNGWVLLEQVPLWYEVWRRLNAFPPLVSIKDETSKDKPSKPPKVQTPY